MPCVNCLCARKLNFLQSLTARYKISTNLELMALIFQIKRRANGPFASHAWLGCACMRAVYLLCIAVSCMATSADLIFTAMHHMKGPKESSMDRLAGQWSLMNRTMAAVTETDRRTN